jgi:hypothetical protein
MAAFGQFNSEVVGFNDNPDVESSREMFRTPGFSGSTVAYLVPNSGGVFDHNNSFRAAGFQTEGAAAMNIFFDWEGPNDPAAWARVSTFAAEVRPNPSVHLQGKVRFKITNVGDFSDGDVGICLGIRETGDNVPMLADGGTIGDIEWVGVSGFGGDPNDPTPTPALIVPASPLAVSVEFDLATGIVKLNGVSQGGGFAAMTGDGTLSAVNNRGTLEHIAFVNQSGDPATRINVHIDEMQFEAPVADPVVPPTVVAPIIDGDATVLVTDVHASADQVQLLLGGGVILTESPDPNDTVVFTLGANAVTGQSYTATQRIGGVTSAESSAVVVLAEASPYGFSFVLDEDGTDCTLDPPGGWEFVGTTALTTVVGGFLYPEGTSLFIDNAQWQTLDFDLTNPTNPWLGGNGTIDPSPNGTYSIDSIWWNVSPGTNVGPHEFFLDTVQVLDGNDVVIETIHTFEDGIHYMGNVRGQSNTTATSSNLSTLASYDGSTSHRVTFSYADTVQKALGVYHNQGLACGTSPTFSDQGVKIRFHVLARSPADPNAPPIPVITGPIVNPQTTVRVVCDPNAASAQLYVNGVATGAPVTVDPNSHADFGGLTLAPGDSISATQLIGAVESGFAYPKVMLAVPPPPTLSGPIFPGATSATVTNLSTSAFATSNIASIYKNGTAIANRVGSAITGGAPSVVVNATLGGPFVQGDVITATQWIDSVEGEHSLPIVVGVPGPTIYAAPAEGDTEIRVLDLDPAASSVEILVDSVSLFSANPGGAASVVVPVSGLLAGDSVTARQVVGVNPSGESPEEIVTIAATSSLIADDFEGALTLWTQGGTVPVALSGAQDSTCPSGAQSVTTPAGNSWMFQNIAQTIPTPTEPVVFNVNIYDPIGAGDPNDPNDPTNTLLQWVELNAADNPANEFFFMHVGMLGWADTDNIHYDFRAIGNGGPNWKDLDEFEAPLRTVGWHNFTVVHKGNFIDVYVDGLLSLKNLPLADPTTYSQCDVGGGNWGNTEDVWIDELYVEVGPVRFGCVPAGCSLEADLSGDGTTNITDLGILLADFGCTPAPPCAGDVSGDGATNITDLGILLAEFGQTCP